MDQSPQQPGSNPYDFITNPYKPKKAPKLGGGSKRSRIILIIGGLFVLMILVSIIGAVLSSVGNSDIKAYKSIVAQQQELIRIAELGDDIAQSSNTRSFAYTTKLSLLTQQKALVGYLGGRKVVLNEVEMASKKKTSVDKELEAAQASNHFDEVFSEKLTSGLTQYAKSMESAYKTSKGEKAKAVLTESYDSSVVLLGVK